MKRLEWNLNINRVGSVEYYHPPPYGGLPSIASALWHAVQLMTSNDGKLTTLIQSM
jgi:hypothetical protein